MSINDWIFSASTQLATADIPTSRLDAELILAHALDKPRTWLIAHDEDAIDTSTLHHANKLLEQRCKRIPLAYLTTTKEFYGRKFYVNEHVLIPRPETEDLIDLAQAAPGLSWSKGMRVLDVGTGSGCIGLTLKAEHPEVELILSDVSLDALSVAKRNAIALDIESVQYIQSNLLDYWLSNTPEQFNLIASNLPYVDRTWERSPETDHEPALALFADNNGLALIFSFIEQAPSLLASEVLLLLEADPEQHPAIVTHAKKHGFRKIESRGYAILLGKS